jgi:hypothetical protein
MPIVRLLPDFGGQEVTVAMVQSLPVATTSFVRQVSTREKREGIQVKTRRKSLIVVTVVVALALTAVLVTASLAIAPPVWAKAGETRFQGWIYFQGGGEPVVEEDCPEGWLCLRNMNLVYDDQMSDPRISGTETVVVNLSMKLVEDPVVLMTGPMWGTSQIVNDDGSWDVVWLGVRDYRGWGYINCVAHGRGDYEGLWASFTGVRKSPDPEGPFKYSGYIFE